MTERYINDYASLFGSVSLTPEDKERISELLIQRSLSKKDLPKKQIAVASAVIILAAGAIYASKMQKK